MIDALPTPFGLVRSGVAPDHHDVKNVQHDFAQVAEDPRLAFLGNVRVGSDLQVEELRKLYHAVVLAYGAASDRWLGIPGETLQNVLSARAFVNWYNGHPEFRDFSPDLSVEDVVIVGHGNVAIDCARVLCKSVDELSRTDIASHALEALSRSRVKRVHLVGRRGHIQASFTMKELREVTKLEDADLLIKKSELDAGRTPASLAEAEDPAARARKRMDALLSDVAAQTPAGKAKQLHLRFLLAPTAVLPAQDRPEAAGAVQFAVTKLEGPAGEQKAVPTGATETIPAGLVLRSVGYKSIRVPGVPFDDKRAVVRNDKGRVMEDDGTTPFTGVYVAGWLKRGPSGIIGSNIPDAKETVACIFEDKAAGRLLPPAASAAAAPLPLEQLRAALVARGKKPSELVSWEDYRRIDAAEVARGQKDGKPRDKFTSVAEMLEAKSN